MNSVCKLKVIQGSKVKESEQQKKPQIQTSSSSQGEGELSGEMDGERVNTSGEMEDGIDDIDDKIPATEFQSQLSPKDQRSLDKAIEKQRSFIKGDTKKTGKLSKSQASTF